LVKRREEPREAPPFHLFAPVKILRFNVFLNRRQRRGAKGGIGELLFDYTYTSLDEWDDEG
jgi:hypothetical protein